MQPWIRDRFDRLLEEILEELPPFVHELIERVPLHVEDYPSAKVMAETGVRHRNQLCGLYTGIPIDQRSIQHSGTLPDMVTVYREGVLAAAQGSDGDVTADALLREIRITILHELAHHHGLDEDDLAELGYD